MAHNRCPRGQSGPRPREPDSNSKNHGLEAATVPLGPICAEWILDDECFWRRKTVTLKERTDTDGDKNRSFYSSGIAILMNARVWY